MDTKTLTTLVARVRELGGEPSEVEVKSAAGGLPKSVVETLCAFANTNGGLLVLGLDESRGFAPVYLDDPCKLRDDLASLASSSLHPALRISVDVVRVEDFDLVVAEVDPLPSAERPCYVVNKGMKDGSYVRVGDGDRRMTQAEIGLTIANQGQPRYDIEPVSDATVEDLDRTALLRTLDRVRQTSRAFRDVDETTALTRLRVLVRDSQGSLVPSLGGMLTFGVYPQQFFPQLTVSIVVHPGDDSGQDTPRFEDNPTVRGAIPDLIAETLSVLRRRMSVRSFVDASGRREQLDYPMEAVREAVVNAVLHRDYSPSTRGTQIQVNLWPDRLEVRSPGGLYGPVVLEDLGEEGVSSSRNAFLASLLADTHLPGSDRLVAENRASGIPAMIRELRRSGMIRPAFRNYVNRFEVEFQRSELLDPRTRRWLSELGEVGLTPLHELALATMFHGQPVSNATLREFGADKTVATSVMRDLVERGLALRSGGRRYATYGLNAAPRVPNLFSGNESTDESIESALRRRGIARTSELIELTGFSRQTVLTRLDELISEGKVATEGKPRSPRRTYRWVGGG
ncbi:putative DNA binding domain-containing protein [Allokutzneria sp. A3M-2-11 16]|uniref:ATP-binding protein n=1 Tax=Allokutzneria sp. A3M-2-11 16 TaxID=2962043 RepID=UPI0020B88A81|nr:ATP-binding protein [Allokutzneria sp. A3M-2-11 16]MCP3800933.1 putative DNA binding domain-containing protein [Allokutzneria sp. A3M-2-11 16]